MASTFCEQTLMARNSAVKILDVTSSASTILAVATVLSANAVEWRKDGGGSSYSTLTTANDVNVKFDRDDNIGFLITWVATQDGAPVGQTMTVEAGSEDNAWQKSLGDFTHTLCTAAHSTDTAMKKWLMGPFEGARFALRATSTATGVKMNQFYIQMKMTTNSSSAESAKVGVLPFRWPDVQYDT